VFVALGPAEAILISSRGSAAPVTLMVRAPAGDGYDPSGAEDAAVAALAAALGAGLALGDAAQLANLAIGIVGTKVGTAVASAGELAAALASDVAERARIRTYPGRRPADRAVGAAASPRRARSAR
jgi:bifunctional ADP-heptose synthase (sugar kinase/adenylyltransferase)